MRKLLLGLFGSIMIAGAAHAGPEVGKPAPEFTGITSEGKTVSLADYAGKPVVLEWTNHLCPYVRKHYESGNMQKQQRQLTEEGAVWISIISSAPGKQGHVTAEEANELSASRGVYADMVVFDASGDIGRLYDAKTTPQMFLIAEDQTIRYMGAIDDKPSARKASLEGARNYLLEAWEAHKVGELAENTNTKPYGCTVKYGSIEGYK